MHNHTIQIKTQGAQMISTQKIKIAIAVHRFDYTPCTVKHDINNLIIRFNGYSASTIKTTNKGFDTLIALITQQ